MHLELVSNRLLVDIKVVAGLKNADWIANANDALFGCRNNLHTHTGVESVTGIDAPVLAHSTIRFRRVAFTTLLINIRKLASDCPADYRDTVSPS